MTNHTAEALSKEELFQIIKRVLNTTRDDLDFLVQLDQEDIERFLVAIKTRVEDNDQPKQVHL
jgi:hypothetical protein